MVGVSLASGALMVLSLWQVGEPEKWFFFLEYTGFSLCWASADIVGLVVGWAIWEFTSKCVD